MRRILRASLLALVLAVSAHAGDMGNGGTEPPPPPQNVSVSETTTDGEMGNPRGNMGNPVTDTASEIGLNLLLTLLALF